MYAEHGLRSECEIPLDIWICNVCKIAILCNFFGCILTLIWNYSTFRRTHKHLHFACSKYHMFWFTRWWFGMVFEHLWLPLDCVYYDGFPSETLMKKWRNKQIERKLLFFIKWNYIWFLLVLFCCSRTVHFSMLSSSFQCIRTALKQFCLHFFAIIFYRTFISRTTSFVSFRFGCKVSKSLAPWFWVQLLRHLFPFSIWCWLCVSYCSKAPRTENRDTSSGKN